MSVHFQMFDFWTVWVYLILSTALPYLTHWHTLHVKNMHFALRLMSYRFSLNVANIEMASCRGTCYSSYPESSMAGLSILSNQNM